VFNRGNSHQEVLSFWHWREGAGGVMSDTGWTLAVPLWCEPGSIHSAARYRRCLVRVYLYITIPVCHHTGAYTYMLPYLYVTIQAHIPVCYNVTIPVCHRTCMSPYLYVTYVIMCQWHVRIHLTHGCDLRPIMLYNVRLKFLILMPIRVSGVKRSSVSVCLSVCNVTEAFIHICLCVYVCLSAA